MKTNPYPWAITSTILLGIVLVPWSAMLKKVGQGPYFIVLGVAFVLGGAILCGKDGANAAAFVGSFWKIAATCAMYVFSLWLLNVALEAAPAAEVPKIAAILSTFTVAATVTTAVVVRTMPAFVQGLTMGIIILAVVLLNLLEKQH